MEGYLYNKVCKKCGKRFQSEAKAVKYCCEECKRQGRLAQYKHQNERRKNRKRINRKYGTKTKREIERYKKERREYEAKKRMENVDPKVKEEAERRIAHFVENRRKGTPEEYARGNFERKVRNYEGKLFNKAVKEILLNPNIDGDDPLKMMIVSVVNRVIATGDPRAFEVLMDTAGEKPVEKKVSANFEMPVFAPPPIKENLDGKDVLINIEDTEEYREFLEWKKNNDKCQG